MHLQCLKKQDYLLHIKEIMKHQMRMISKVSIIIKLAILLTLSGKDPETRP